MAWYDKLSPYILIGTLVILICLPIYAFIQHIRDERVYNKRTFEFYKKRRPDLVNSGKVKCFYCEGTSIWMKRVTPTRFAHTCRTCGSELYYSKG